MTDADLHARDALIHTRGLQRGIQLSVTPVGCRALFGAPAAAFASEIVLGDEAGAVPSSLQRRLEDLPWTDRFAAIDEFVGSRLDLHQAATRPEVDVAWRCICASHGSIRVANLAREVGWSRRHLQAQFVAEYGVGPKQAAQIARFAYARAMLDSAGRNGPAAAAHSLADVAARAGYADQSHLNREWRALASQTPRETLGEFPIVQDATAAT